MLLGLLSLDTVLAQRTGLGVSLCTDLLRSADDCLVSCPGFYGFLFSWLVLFLLSRKLQDVCTEQQETECLEVG